MTYKLNLKFADIITLLFGFGVLVLNPYTNEIYRVQRGEDTYICRG